MLIFLEWQKTKVALKVNTAGKIDDFLSEARLMMYVNGFRYKYYKYTNAKY
jgi:hypothetical protein